MRQDIVILSQACSVQRHPAVWAACWTPVEKAPWAEKLIIAPCGIISMSLLPPDLLEAFLSVESLPVSEKLAG